MRAALVLFLLALLPAPSGATSPPAEGPLVAAILTAHPGAPAEDIRAGVRRCLLRWRPGDGELEPVLAEQYAPPGPARDALFARLQHAMEMLDGHLNALGREWRRGVDVAMGEELPVDRLLAGYNPYAHVTEDLFANGLAWAVLVNFPLPSLEEKQEEGASWTRRQWAEARLAERFAARVPAEAQQAWTAATSAADRYVNGYNLWVHHLVTPEGERPFAAGKRLISHWNLRDELKAAYAEPDALTRQRLLQAAMVAIVRQEIPRGVIDNPAFDWVLPAGELREAPEATVDGPVREVAGDPAGREPDTRYARLRDVFLAAQRIDAHRPDLPTHIARGFEGEREMSAQRVRELLLSLFEGDSARGVAQLIAAREGRPCEPFDIWYSGFQPRAGRSEADLDAITRERYPTAEAYAADIPRQLHELGFDDAQVELLASHIVVDPSRGAGHALGGLMRGDPARLRTRVAEGGMDYKGYNIAVHELGHNVEQVLGIERIDHTLLNGVPGNAFTEALAFVFQERDLELLGVAGEGGRDEHAAALEAYWSACEIGAASLVDLGVWEWMYERGEFTPAELREATVSVAAQVWAQTFGPVLGLEEGSELLAIYSHMLAYPLYLPHYPVGHIVAFQLEEHFGDDPPGPEFARVATLGRLTPDLWMQRAVGSPVSAQPLREAAARAVKALAE